MRKILAPIFFCSKYFSVAFAYCCFCLFVATFDPLLCANSLVQILLCPTFFSKSVEPFSNPVHQGQCEKNAVNIFQFKITFNTAKIQLDPLEYINRLQKSIKNYLCIQTLNFKHKLVNTRDLIKLIKLSPLNDACSTALLFCFQTSFSRHFTA